MNEKVFYRMFQESDRPALNEIVRKTWNYDRFCTPETSSAIASFYFQSRLANQTYTQVALLDGKPIGIIIVKDLRCRRSSPLSQLRLFFSACFFMLSKERRNIFRGFAHTEQINKKLLHSCKTNYEGEIVFFMLDADYRGKGIGKSLFQKAVSYMKARQISRFFLFTDTSCNYGFYDHLKMTQRRKEKYDFEINGQRETMTFFLYDAQSGLAL